MRTTSLRRGLWLRMAVASLIGLAGVLAVIAVELAATALVSTAVVAGVPELAGVLLALAVAGGGLLLAWWTLAAVLGRIVPPGVLADRLAHDGVADAVARVGAGLRNPERVLPPRALALVGGGSLAVLGAHAALVEVLEIPVGVVGVLVGLGAVGWQTTRLVRREFGRKGVVRTDLEETYRVIGDPDREADVEARVRRLARQADLPAPDVRIGASWTPQAATVGYRPAGSVVVVSRGLVDALDDRQLDAVLAHELAHVGNRDAAVLTALSLPATKALGLLERFGHPIVLPVVVPVYASSRLSVALVARYREFVADGAAAAITGDPAALASALEALDADHAERPTTDLRDRRTTAAFGIVPPPWEEREYFDGLYRLLLRGVLGTHPPTAARIERLRDAVEADP